MCFINQVSIAWVPLIVNTVLSHSTTHGQDDSHPFIVMNNDYRVRGMRMWVCGFSWMFIYFLNHRRWPLMTKLLEKKGWKKTGLGDGSPLISFHDAGHSAKEAECKERHGKMLRMFSRAYTDVSTHPSTHLPIYPSTHLPIFHFSS